MKNYIFVAGLCLAIASSAYAESEVKKVCHDKTDAKGAVVKGKDGKVVQTCKDVKIHKKLEGTKVPEKK
jgi:hypothetical protein